MVFYCVCTTPLNLDYLCCTLLCPDSCSCHLGLSLLCLNHFPVTRDYPCHTQIAAPVTLDYLSCAFLCPDCCPLCPWTHYLMCRVATLPYQVNVTRDSHAISISRRWSEMTAYIFPQIQISYKGTLINHLSHFYNIYNK